MAKLNETQKAVIKRCADILEKLGVAGMALAVFQGSKVGAVFGGGFLMLSILLPYLTVADVEYEQ